jgi:(2Fe-2S) ferredoxin
MDTTSQSSHSPATPSSKCIRVCQNRTCRKQGAAKVLAAFEALPIPGVAIAGCGCLGQCGNGPMVLVLPERVCYRGVHPSEVPLLVEQHLRGG